MNAIILSGGKGSRLGNKEKAFLTLDKETFIERKTKMLKPFFDKIIVVTNMPKLYAGLKVKIVRDEKENVGPLMGLYCGLKNSPSDYNFVTTSDTPFLKREIVQYLIENVNDYDAIVPEWRGNIEPLCAVYSKRCVPHIEKVMAERRVRAFFKYINVKFIPETAIKKIDPEGLSFFNVNAKKDYKKATKLVLCR